MAGFTIAYLAAEHATGLAAISRALALNPNSAHAWGAKGLVESYLGRADQAIDSIERALRLSPLDPLRSYFEIGFSLALIGDIFDFTLTRNEIETLLTLRGPH